MLTEDNEVTTMAYLDNKHTYNITIKQSFEKIQTNGLKQPIPKAQGSPKISIQLKHELTTSLAQTKR
jgi:hypothetical protein